MRGSSQGTSNPESGPSLDHRPDARVLDTRHHPSAARSRYRGSSRTAPRRGQARAPRAVRGHTFGHQCVAAPPTLVGAAGGQDAACRRFCQVRLGFTGNPFAGIACWAGAQVWVELQVADAYRRGYAPTVLPELRATRGGGVSLRAIKLVAAVMAEAAEHRSGQGSRLTNATLIARTGLGRSTVQRARLALRLLGVATEVFRGRQRTYAERMASWRVGDRARGWASVWALHPATPVDETRIIRAGQVQMAPHPRRGLFPRSSLGKKGVSTGTGRPTGPADGATRRGSPTKAGHGPAGAPDGSGLALSKALRAHPECPGWIRRYSPHAYAAALSRWAHAGWTARDVVQHLDDTAAAGLRIYETPRNPVKYLLALLHRADLGERPTLWRDAHAASEAQEAAQRNAAVPAERAAAIAAREAGRAALSGWGRAEVRAMLNQDRSARPRRSTS